MFIECLFVCFVTAVSSRNDKLKDVTDFQTEKAKVDLLLASCALTVYKLLPPEFLQVQKYNISQPSWDHYVYIKRNKYNLVCKINFFYYTSRDVMIS